MRSGPEAGAKPNFLSIDIDDPLAKEKIKIQNNFLINISAKSFDTFLNELSLSEDKPADIFPQKFYDFLNNNASYENVINEIISLNPSARIILTTDYLLYQSRYLTRFLELTAAQLGIKLQEEECLTTQHERVLHHIMKMKCANILSAIKDHQNNIIFVDCISSLIHLKNQHRDEGTLQEKIKTMLERAINNNIKPGFCYLLPDTQRPVQISALTQWKPMPFASLIERDEYASLLEMLENKKEGLSGNNPLHTAIDTLEFEAARLLKRIIKEGQVIEYSISAAEGIEWKKSMNLAIKAFESPEALIKLRKRIYVLSQQEKSKKWTKFLSALLIVTGLLMAMFFPTFIPILIGTALTSTGTCTLFYSNKHQPALKNELTQLANTIS